MITYWIALILTILLSKILTNEKVKLGKIGYGKITHIRVFLSFLPLFLVALFRWNVGVDVVYKTGYYYKAYNAIGNSLGNVFNYELGFYWLMEIFNFFNLKIYYFYSFITIIFFVLITKFISENSKNVSLSAIIFVLSDLYLFSFSTLRQSLGIAFALYPLTKIIKNKFNYKDIYAWVFIVISLLMHNTILYVYIIVLISKIKFSKKSIISISLISIILYPFIQIVIEKIIQNSTYFNKYVGSDMFVSEFSITYFIIALSLFIIALLNYRKIMSLDNKNYVLINICAFTTVIMTYSKLLIMPYRIFPLFIPFYIALGSKIIEGINKKTYSRLLTYMYLIIPFLFLFINQYYFENGSEYFKYKTIFEYSEQVFNR